MKGNPMRHLSCLALAVLALAASACGLPQAAAPDAVATSVAGTLTASAPTLAPLPDTPTPPPPRPLSGLCVASRIRDRRRLHPGCALRPRRGVLRPQPDRIRRRHRDA